jgi:hypothetical protein
MTSLVGIGGTGCKLATQLSSYSQYDVLEIDKDKNIKSCSSPEEYEKKCPDFKKNFKRLSDDVYLFLSACGDISGITLRVLEQLKEKKVSVVLVISPEDVLGKRSKLQQNLVVGVLQEYARSGLLECLYLIENSKVETLLSDIPLDKYYDSLNEAICYVFHNLLWCKNNKPVFETKEEESEIAKISTFGILDQEEKLVLFYEMENVTKQRFFYNFSEKEIKTNGKLLQDIKRYVRSDDQTNRTFAIFSVSDGHYSCLVEARTHFVQKNEKEINNERTA